MVNVHTKIHIRFPRADVASYAGNPENAAEWYQNIASVRWLSGPPLQVGSQVAFTAYFLRRRLDYTYEFVEIVPNKRLVMRTQQGPFPMQTTYSWSDTGAGTDMTLSNSGAPKGFSKIAVIFMAPMMRRAMRKDLAKLKSILEARAPQT